MNRKKYISLAVFAAVGVGLLVGVADKFGGKPDNKWRLGVMVSPSTTEGSYSVSPSSGTSGEFGTWMVSYTVGAEGIRAGGGIRVELPDAWHSGPYESANRLQATDPSDDHYVSAHSSRDDVELEMVVESETERVQVRHPKWSLDGRWERYVFVVRVRVVEGQLDEGDRLVVTYGDRSEGSRGYRAAAIATAPQPILLALDSDGTNRFQLHASRDVTLQSLPGEPVEMLLHLPSNGRPGESLTATLSVLDKQRNAVDRVQTVDLEELSGSVSFPTTVTLPPDAGFVQFEISPQDVGIVRLRATARTTGLIATSNPIDVRSETLDTRIYWGDLHSHTYLSWDGVGEDPFHYARYVSGLDFFAMTDHANTPSEGKLGGLSLANWDAYTDSSDEHHDPTHFVTLHAYERSMGAPHGHHNVYFRDRPGPLLFESETTLPQLWEALREGDALTVPHHTGKFPAGIELLPQNPGLRRNFEIYSNHGLSESYDPDHLLAFERKSKSYVDPKSQNQPSYAQDAWQLGLRLSTIASSDDHRAQPGQPQDGIVAVRARSLTREGIFQALYERATYATTGARVILDFSVNGAPMGHWAEVSSDALARVRVVGTDRLERVELLRYLPSASGFEVLKRWEPDGARFEGEYEDNAVGAGAIYYVRVKQRNLVRGLPVMAWSSPVWTQAP